MFAVWNFVVELLRRNRPGYKSEYQAISSHLPSFVPELEHGESEGANSAGDFLFDARFAHTAYHCFNSGAV